MDPRGSIVDECHVSLPLTLALELSLLELSLDLCLPLEVSPEVPLDLLGAAILLQKLNLGRVDGRPGLGLTLAAAGDGGCIGLSPVPRGGGIDRMFSLQRFDVHAHITVVEDLCLQRRVFPLLSGRFGLQSDSRDHRFGLRGRAIVPRDA